MKKKAKIASKGKDDIRIEVAKAIMELPGDLRLVAAKAALDAFGAREIVEEEEVVGFGDFVRKAWHIVEPETPLIESFYVDAIVEHLEAVASGDIRRLVICVPRRMGKSILCCVLYPAWLFSVDPSIRLIFASYSMPFVRRDAIKTRDLIRSHWYRSRYGHRVEIKQDQEQAHWFYTTRGGFRLATSPGGVGIGEGADIQVVDDPHKLTDVYSQTKRQYVIDWWESTMSGSARDPNTLRRVVVQQRLHSSDLAGVCIAKGYEALILPMEYDGVKRKTSLGYYDKRETVGELLCPERMNEDDVAMLKEELGPRGYYAQCQQSPRGDEMKMFVESDWVFWHTGREPALVDIVSIGEVPVVPLPQHFDNICISWDIAVGNDAKGDFSVGQVWAVSGDTYFLLDQVRFRGGYSIFSEKFRLLCSEWPYVNTKLVEESAISMTLLDILETEYDGIVRIPAAQDKQIRAEVVAQLQKRHRVVIPSPYEKQWVYDFVREFADFSSEFSRHDDQVDAASQAIIYMKRNIGFAFA